MATTVIVNQPVVQGQGMLVGSVRGIRDWDSGLFSCFTDICSLIKTCCFFNCSVCELATKTGDCCLTPFCLPGGLISGLTTLRTRIRTLGGIHGSTCVDCLVVTLCTECAVCQMQRELNAMGL